LIKGEKYEAIVAPTIPYSYYPAFVAYAGSSSLSREITCESLVQICNDWHKQGAQKFYVLNTGISTNKPLQDAKEQLNKSGIVFEYLDLSSLYKDKRILDITQQKMGTHADEIETSIMLHIHPEVVHMEKAQPE
jgi:creatinine amidohydrolase